jgi:hypothetical protein
VGYKVTLHYKTVLLGASTIGFPFSLHMKIDELLVSELRAANGDTFQYA